MRAFLFLALFLALTMPGCGDGGDGATQQAPAEAPPCDPPDLTCPEPQRHESEPAGRVQIYCESDGVTLDMLGERVVGWTEATQSARCWPGGAVATLKVGAPGEAGTEVCYDEAGKPADCEPIAAGGWAAAWGF